VADFLLYRSAAEALKSARQTRWLDAKALTENKRIKTPRKPAWMLGFGAFCLFYYLLKR
jgi:hypothetical protein